MANTVGIKRRPDIMVYIAEFYQIYCYLCKKAVPFVKNGTVISVFRCVLLQQLFFSTTASCQKNPTDLFL